MLAETIYEPAYIIGWGGLGFVFGLIACCIYYNKGYGSEAVAGLIGGLICFPLGLLAVIQALAAVDKNQQEEQRRREGHIQNQLARQQRQLARMAEQAVPSGFFLCPRCGAQNGEAQGACWQCKLPFAAEAEVVDAPAPIAAAAPPVLDTKLRCIKCRRKFSGAPAKLATLKACPGCKASPFLTEPA